MADAIIKNFFIFLCIFKIYMQLLNIKMLSPIRNLVSWVTMSIFLSLLTFLTKTTFEPIPSYILPICILWTIFSIFSNQPKLSFITTILSFSISYCIFVLSTTIIILIMGPILYNMPSFPYYAFMLCAGCLEMLLIKFLFSLRRLKNGMPFLYTAKFSNIGTFISALCLACMMYTITPNQHERWAKRVLIVIFILTILLLIYWWQAQIKKQYLRYLQTLELESLRLELQEKEAKIEQLSKHNEALGRLIHKDNKLIPAAINAVYDYLSTPSGEASLAKGQELIAELEQLSNFRQQTLWNLNATDAPNFETGITSLNTTLQFRYKQAQAEDIRFSFHIATAVSEKLKATISAEDVTHLISNLIDNAFIATIGCPIRKVQLQIYESRGNIILEISDNGIPFEIASIMNFGITARTTHADTGGNGIGLLDIWELKQKYRASLHITEYDHTTPYSKRIVISFNKKNKFIVYSWRAKELLSALSRSDLQILEKSSASEANKMLESNTSSATNKIEE